MSRKTGALRFDKLPLTFTTHQIRHSQSAVSHHKKPTKPHTKETQETHESSSEPTQTIPSRHFLRLDMNQFRGSHKTAGHRRILHNLSSESQEKNTHTQICFWDVCKLANNKRHIHLSFHVSLLRLLPSVPGSSFFVFPSSTGKLHLLQVRAFQGCSSPYSTHLTASNSCSNI